MVTSTASFFKKEKAKYWGSSNPIIKSKIKNVSIQSNLMINKKNLKKNNYCECKHKKIKLKLHVFYYYCYFVFVFLY